MTEPLYFTTEMPTECLDQLAPDQDVVEQRSDDPSEKGMNGHQDLILDPSQELECRIALLEVAFQNHALEIRDKMAARIAHLEEKLAEQSSEIFESIREERFERKDAIDNLSSSVANAIDRVESATAELSS